MDTLKNIALAVIGFLLGAALFLSFLQSALPRERVLAAAAAAGASPVGSAAGAPSAVVLPTGIRPVAGATAPGRVPAGPTAAATGDKPASVTSTALSGEALGGLLVRTFTGDGNTTADLATLQEWAGHLDPEQLRALLEAQSRLRPSPPPAGSAGAAPTVAPAAGR